MNRVVVATDCPSCGAPLDFDEGSNAVTCGHCGSNLLVTGRKQLLSYSVSSKLDERKAVALAVMAQRNMGRDGFRGISAGLYFVPYYRMTGQEFSWEKTRPKPLPEEEYSGDLDHPSFGWQTPGASGRSIFGNWNSILDVSGELFGTLLEKTLGGQPDSYDPLFTLSEENAVSHKNHEKLEEQTTRPMQTPPTGGSLYESGDVNLNDRYIEKNFLACDLDGSGLYSLGVRPAVLRLALFRPDTLKTLGRIVPPAMGPDAAESVGLKTAPDGLRLYRKVIGKILSLVYFPFWFVKMENRDRAFVTVIDAVSEAVIKADAPVSVYKILDREFRDTPGVIGFRPLTCPNCGWDFPVRPDNTIFFCKTCSKAWQICGSELCEVQYEVADPALSSEASSLQYLPFWVLNLQKNTGGRLKFFMPAFRYRRLKFLLDLGLKISRLQPSYKATSAKGLDLSGCYYDTDDAVLLAQFVQAILETNKTEELGKGNQEGMGISDSILTWVPFGVNGAYLSSPFGSISIPRNLLQK